MEVLIKRITIYWGLYWGPLSWGNYHKPCVQCGGAGPAVVCHGGEVLDDEGILEQGWPLSSFDAARGAFDVLFDLHGHGGAGLGSESWIRNGMEPGCQKGAYVENSHVKV